MYVAASSSRAGRGPTVATRTPPSAAPSSRPRRLVSWTTALTSRSRSAGTTCGSTARQAGWNSATPKPSSTAKHTSRAVGDDAGASA